jgi:hypothetical protein
MPLPIRKERILYVDHDKSVKTIDVKVKNNGYKPEKDYYPTMRACKCMKCGQVGALLFEGGMNLKLGDRVMDGKPIPGQCPRCGKTELIPLPVNDPSTKEVALYHQIQKSMDHYRERGIDAKTMLWPVDRVKEWEKNAGRDRVQA